MPTENLENIILKVIKRIILVILSSGLITNALYIFGMFYYQGYIIGHGFQYTLFPITWDDSILWTYSASNYLGLSLVEFLLEFISSKYSLLAFIILILILLIILKFWRWSEMNIEKPASDSVKNTLLSRWLKKIQSKHLLLSKLIELLRWFFDKNLFIAFFASYFFSIFIIFIILFCFIWLLFPYLGQKHGELIAEQRLDGYSKYLCEEPKYRWNKCITVDASHISSNLISGKKKSVTGRLIFMDNNLMAIYSESGPVTISKPKNFFHRTSQNSCFPKGCKPKKVSDTEKSSNFSSN